MRSGLLLGGLTLTLALGCPIRGLADPEIRHVTVKQATVHANPSDRPESYITNRLNMGDPVEVVESRPDGWLKILPPEGSFSWINTRFLDHVLPNRPNLVVTEPDAQVPVFVGSVAQKSRPKVIGTYLKRGTQVTSIGPALPDNEGMWMPIEPPPGEYRYVRAENVTPSVGDYTNRAALAGRPLGQPGFPGVGPAGPPDLSVAPLANPNAPPPDYWLKAQAAERAGQMTEAIRLYLQVAHDTISTNPPRSAEATQRALYLQNSYRAYGNAGGFARAPIETNSTQPPAGSPEEGRVYPLPTETASVPLQPIPNAGGTSAPGVPVSRSAASPAVPSVAPMNSRYPVYSGRLRRAGRNVDDRQAYVLEVNNAPTLYITPQPGVDLEPFVNYNIQVSGPTVYRGDLRANYLTAVQVRYIP